MKVDRLATRRAGAGALAEQQPVLHRAARHRALSTNRRCAGAFTPRKLGRGRQSLSPRARRHQNGSSLIRRRRPLSALLAERQPKIATPLRRVSVDKRHDRGDHRRPSPTGQSTFGSTSPARSYGSMRSTPPATPPTDSSRTSTPSARSGPTSSNATNSPTDRRCRPSVGSSGSWSQAETPGLISS